MNAIASILTIKGGIFCKSILEKGWLDSLLTVSEIGRKFCFHSFKVCDTHAAYFFDMFKASFSFLFLFELILRLRDRLLQSQC